MFPNQATTIYDEFITSGVKTLLASSTRTILDVHVQSGVASSTSATVFCGSTSVLNEILYIDTSNGYDFDLLMNKECDSEIKVIAGAGNKTYITYVPYKTSELGMSYEPKTNIATSTDIQVYGSMSAGEILISFFLFALIVLKMIEFLTGALDRIQTKKKYLAYHGGDVEIREDL